MPRLETNLLKSFMSQVTMPSCTERQTNHFQLSYDGTVLRIEDDGLAFDPLVELNPKKSTAESHIGSYVVDEFVKTFENFVVAKYLRLRSSGGYLNVLEFNIVPSAIKFLRPAVVDVPVHVGKAYGRRAAERLAHSSSIPSDVKELILTVGTVHNLSALFEFIRQMLLRLPHTVVLALSLRRTVFSEDMKSWFKDSRLKIKPR